MNGFVVFELAPPFTWKIKTEHAEDLHRWIWLWFSFTIVMGHRWSDFLILLLNQEPDKETHEILSHRAELIRQNR